MKLNVHGDYDLTLQGEIFISRFYQVWNEECAKKFWDSFKQYLGKTQLKKFGMLADFTELEGATPEAIVYFHKISKWAMEQGQIARAQLLNSRLNEYIVNIASNGLDLFPIKTFKDKASALAWLAQQGLAIE